MKNAPIIVFVTKALLSAAAMLFWCAPAYAAAFQQFRVFTGGSVAFSYEPEGAQCRNAVKGRISVGGTAVPASAVTHWDPCHGSVRFEVPATVSYGRVVVAMDDGKTLEPGELFVLAEPVIQKVTRLVLGAGEITRVTVDGSNFGTDFFQRSLFIGRKEIIEAGWSTTRIMFDVKGTVPDTDIVTLRAGKREAGFSRFATEPAGTQALPLTVTATSEETLAAGSTLSVYGYGFGGDGCALRASIAGTRLPDGTVTAVSGLRIDIKTPASMNSSGTIRIECVRRDGSVAAAGDGPQVSVLTSFSNDQYAEKQDYIRSLRVSDAWGLSRGSADVVVAVIDSGIDTNNPDMSSNIWTNKDELPGNKVDDDKNGYVDDVHGYDFAADIAELTPTSEHGTAVASIIGAEGNNGLGITGINWHVQLMPLQVFGPHGATAEDVGEAIRYAADNGASVINLSLGGEGWTNDYSEALTEPIAYAYEKGAVIVAAAGNGDRIDGYGRNLDLNPNSPACNDGGKNMVIGVGSVNAERTKSVFSDYGKCIDVVAFGEDIAVLGALGSVEDGYLFGTGTSFAAPMVSGVAALLKAVDPTLSNDQVRQILTSTARPILLQNVVYGVGLGAGLIDARAALEKAAASVAPKTEVKPEAKPSTETAKPTKPSSKETMSDRLRGRILLQVQAHGEAWFVHPSTGRRHYMRDGAVAYQMMRDFGLGITDADLSKIPIVADTTTMQASSSACSSGSVAGRVKGQILLQVQAHGEAWYIDPEKCRRIYMKDGVAAYEIMRYLGLGITDADLTKIVAGE